MDRYPSKLNNQQGFTLIEALIALFVLTIGILALNSMQISAIQGNATANNLTIATSVARDCFERFMSVDINDNVGRVIFAAHDPHDPNDRHTHSNDTPHSKLNNFTLPDGINDIQWRVMDWGNDNVDNDNDGSTDEADEGRTGIKEITMNVNYDDRGQQKTFTTTFLKHEVL